VVKPCERRNVVTYAIETHRISITRACKTVGLSKTMYYYKSIKDDSIVIDKLTELAKKKPMEGQDKYYARIRNEGLLWNRKRVRRIYLLMGLNHKRKHKKRIPQRVKQPLLVPSALNEVWSMDFMSDAMENRRKFRTLNIIDDHNREALWVEASFSFPSRLVIRALENVIAEKGQPKIIRTDNGPEFISGEFQLWCESKGIKQQFTQPGKPMQNGYIERFNRSFRTDILDFYLFNDLMQVNILAENWMEEYNNERPHEALGQLPSLKYKDRKLIDILKTFVPQVSNMSTSNKQQMNNNLSILHQS
jgi:putative transposase